MLIVRHEIQNVLDGDIDALWSAFEWDESPEGFLYWDNVLSSGKLSDEARAKLEAMLND